MYDITDLEGQIDHIISLISSGKSDEAASALGRLRESISSAFEEMETEKEAIENELEDCREELEMKELEPEKEPILF